MSRDGKHGRTPHSPSTSAPKATPPPIHPTPIVRRPAMPSPYSGPDMIQPPSILSSSSAPASHHQSPIPPPSRRKGSYDLPSASSASPALAASSHTRFPIPPLHHHQPRIMPQPAEAGQVGPTARKLSSHSIHPIQNPRPPRPGGYVGPQAAAPGPIAATGTPPLSALPQPVAAVGRFVSHMKNANGMMPLLSGSFTQRKRQVPVIHHQQAQQQQPQQLQAQQRQVPGINPSTYQYDNESSRANQTAVAGIQDHSSSSLPHDDASFFGSSSSTYPLAQYAASDDEDGNIYHDQENSPGEDISCLRAFRRDGTFSTVSCPVNIGTYDLCAILARKFWIENPTDFRLYIERHGLERVLQRHEKPLLIQRKLLRCAGYTASDRIDEQGREDNTYICRFIFDKQARVPNFDLNQYLHQPSQYIDLRSRNLTSIPPFFYETGRGATLLSLDLSQNMGLDVGHEEHLHRFHNLRELRLSANFMTDIPQTLMYLRSLTHLDLSCNDLKAPNVAPLLVLPHLTSLSLNGNKLKHLPIEFGNLRRLETLILSNNRFQDFPTATCDIKSLQHLDLSFNAITRLPEDLSKMKTLQRLFLSYNEISGPIPESWASMDSLRELRLRGNRVSDVQALSQFRKLRVAQLEDNQANINRHLELSQITELSLEKNSFTTLNIDNPACSLTYVNLSDCNMAALPEAMFHHLPNLTTLIITRNKVSVLPPTIGNLTKLRELRASYNGFRVIPAEIQKLVSLKLLDLHNNNLASLPPEIWLLPSLVTLNASSNVLESFPLPPDQSFNGGKSTSFLATLPLSVSLEKLLLGDNRLAEDVFEPIILFSELKTLNLCFNEIIEVPERVLQGLVKLEFLYLSGNQIASLPEDIATLKSLRWLFVNGNKMTSIPAFVGKLGKLSMLDVGANNLKYNVNNWPYDWNWNWNLELRYLNLSNNKRLEIKPNLSTQNLEKMQRDLSDFKALTKIKVLGLMDLTIRVSLPEENDERRIRTTASEIGHITYGMAQSLGNYEILCQRDLVVKRSNVKIGQDDEYSFGLFDGWSDTWVDSWTSASAKAKAHAKAQAEVQAVVDHTAQMAVKAGQAMAQAAAHELSEKASIAQSAAQEASRAQAASQNATQAVPQASRLAKYLADNLYFSFTTEMQKPKTTIKKALKWAFLTTNKEFASLNGTSWKPGVSCVFGHIGGTSLFIANVGDAKAVLSRNGNALQVTVDHSVDKAEEMKRIQRAGGFVTHQMVINGEVSATRQFGCYHLSPIINADPDVTEVPLDGDADEFLIIASKALWNHMSPQMAVDVARSERRDLTVAAQKLRDLATTYGADQPVMVMVIGLKDFVKKVVMRNRTLARRSHSAGLRMQPRRRQNKLGDSRLQRLDAGGGMEKAPTGEVALVFTDIKSSTALWEMFPVAMSSSIKEHNSIMRRLLRQIGGYEVKTEGDAFMVSFPNVFSALQWCLCVQNELLNAQWPAEVLESEQGREVYDSDGDGELLFRGLRVRMGIHVGRPGCEPDPITRRMDYYGPMVNRSARVSSVADGGEICISGDVLAELVDYGVLGDTPFGLQDAKSRDAKDADKRFIGAKLLKKCQFTIVDIGERKLKGLENPDSLSLVFPEKLKGRYALNHRQEAPTPVILPGFSDSDECINSEVIRTLAFTVLRLERIGTGRLHSPFDEIWDDALVVDHKALLEEETVIRVLESLVVRIENSLSTLYLRRMGKYSNVLERIAHTCDIDPTYLERALAIFSELSGNSVSSQSLS